MDYKTKKLTATGMFCALAYLAVVTMRIPLILFLKYEPKDVVITIGGLIFGPLTSFWISLIVSFVQMLTISENGILGFLMNVISSCSFACTAALIYNKRCHAPRAVYCKKKRTCSGMVAGLLSGWACMIVVMLLWNYLITPLYMGTTRKDVARLLLPAFLPFNFIKGGLNAAITMFLYKPVVTALRRARMVPEKRSAPLGRSPRDC